MVKTLRDHFPIIRDREEVLADIYSKEELLEWYESWEEEQQELFLEYCTGMRGVRIFEELYMEVYKACQNTEAMMGLFSEELFELDRNTVEYMLEEQKKELEEMQGEIAEQKKELEEKRGEIAEQKKELEEKRGEIAEQKKELEEMQGEIAEQKKELEDKSREIAEKDAMIAQLRAQLEGR